MENLKEKKNKEFIFLCLVNHGKVKEKWKENKINKKKFMILLISRLSTSIFDNDYRKCL